MLALVLLVVTATDDEGVMPGPRFVWLAPNLGSEDLLDLFREPAAWPEARVRLDVLQLYAQHLAADASDCPGCGPNLRAGFEDAGAFRRMEVWKLDLAVETSALKEWGCTARPHVVQLRTALRVAGGAHWIVLDEPRLGADACRLPVAKAAREVAQVIAAARSLAPDARVGLVEPWPAFSLVQLEEWLDAIEAHGAHLDFLHLDVDRRYARQRGYPVGPALQQAAQLSQRRGITLGVVLWADAPDGATWAREVRTFAREVVDAIGWPEHVVFQSWAQAPDGSRRLPPNLPEDRPGTATHLMLETLGYADGGERRPR